MSDNVVDDKLIKDAARSGVSDLAKRGSIAAFVIVFGALFVFAFWPWLDKLSESQREIKNIPEHTKRLDKLESTDKDAAYERKDLDKRVKALEKWQDDVAPRTPRAPPGWETVIQPAEKKRLISQ